MVIATDDRPGALVGARLAAGDWPAPAVVFVGPTGSGKTTLLNAICRKLELKGTTVASGDHALRASATQSGVAVVDGLGLRETAAQVASLVEVDWRVIGAVLGPSPEVTVEFGLLSDIGLVRIVELRSLRMKARRNLLGVVLSGADPAAVDLISRCGPGDGRALRVLAARIGARCRVTAGAVDVGAAAATLRGGLRLGANGPAPPVPRLIRDLVEQPSPRAAEAVVASLGDSLRPLAVLGPAEEPVGAVRAGAPVAVAGGTPNAVAVRSALHHALAGRRVLLHTASVSETAAAEGMVRLAGGRQPTDGPANDLAAELVAGLGLVVLADAAVSLSDLPSTLRRCYAHTGVRPEIVVVDGPNLDELSWAERADVPVVVAAAHGAALPPSIESSTLWDIATTTVPPAIRRSGSEWVRLPTIEINGQQKVALARSGGALTRDDTGAVLGWRLWELAVNGQGAALRSPLRKMVWPRGVVVAACASCGPLPSESCRCGIYAYNELFDAVAEWRHQPNLIIGRVRCWGRVLRHESGFRAQRAQPVLLHLGTVATETERRALSARYGCEVTVGRGTDR